MGVLWNSEKRYAQTSLELLFQAYMYEHINPKERQDLEKFLESNFPEEFNEFKEYERKIEERTPNIKQIYFDYLDGKRDHPGFEYFTSEGL